MTTYENIRFALEHTEGISGKERIDAEARKYIELVGLTNFANAYPNTLSGECGSGSRSPVCSPWTPRSF